MDFVKAIEIANNIYWIGEYLENDSFQCHPYFIKNENESILIDPGSILEFNTVVNKVNQISSLKNIKYIIIHHQDPDLCASVPMLEKLIARPDLQIVTHSRIKELVKHFCLNSQYYEVDKNNFKLSTSTGLKLDFLSTPYCHSPGAIVTYESNTKTLFSSDLFGGMTESWNFYADENYFNEIKSFHETYMPSKDILNYSLSKIEKLDLELIAPQHGSIIKKEFIYPLICKMKNLECGLYISKKYNEAFTQIKEKESFLNTVIESNSSAIISINKHQVVQIYNKSAQQMFGFTKKEMIGKNTLEKIIPDKLWRLHELAVSNFIRTKQSSGIIGNYHSLSAIRKDGEEFPIRIGFGVTIVDNDVIIVANIVDISLQKMQNERLTQQNEALHYQSTHDTLTGLPNRLLFFKHFEQIIETAKKTDMMSAILFLDFDHFKEINDSLGHAIGDLLLIEISKKLLNLFHTNNNYVAHLGGDSFSIIIKPINNIQYITDTANSVLSLFQQAIYVQEHEFYITCSIGISIYPNDADNAQTLLRDADSAMYKAKEKGRNSYHFYTADMTEKAYQRVSIESHLRKALEKQNLIVYYQPQYNAKTNKLIGMEALARWFDENMGMVSPDTFIPVAEETGLIIKVDRFIMLSAMKQTAKWHQEGLNPGRIALNISVKHLQAEDFLDNLKLMLKESKCKPEYIELEVTESQVMSDPKHAIGILKEISNMGIKLAIDDFGTGYSSLAYLKRLPVDKLKIDKSFICGLPDDDEDSEIVKAIIVMSKSLKLGIIAEGVETNEQKNFLLSCGCSNIQGYLFAKPMPANEVIKILKNNQKFT